MTSTDIDPRRSTIDMDNASYALNVNNDVAKRVIDDEATALLTSILGALGGATFNTPSIFNVSAPTANTEVSQALPSNTKRFLIRCRGPAKVQFSFTSGASGTTFITIPSGSSFSVDNLMIASGTIYFQTNQNAQVVEILAWA